MWKLRCLPIVVCLMLLPHPDLRGQVVVLQSAVKPAIEASTVVVCDPRDSYHALALEIARTESIAIYADVGHALENDPRFLLWVGSPQYFSDKVLVQFEMTLQAKHARTSPGIITGSTLEDARALWQRAGHAGGGRVYAVNGEYPSGQVTHGRILSPDLLGVVGKRNLGKSELTEALSNADYLSFTGHGGGTYWRLAAGTSYTDADLPRLPPIVMATAGCQGVRLNVKHSFALAAVARGAAAYAGFLFSPIEGYLIGEFDGLPLRHTWPGVTIGEVVRMQNHGAMQAITAFPFYVLLGDPRISLQPDASWVALNIETVRGVRTCDYGETMPGFFPVRIKNGAQYHYIEIPDVAAASDYDPFYNSRLQMVNSGPDKLLLVLHPGGNLKISMRPEPPRFWRWTDPVLDSLDHTLLFVGGGESLWISMGIAGIALIGAVGLLRISKGTKRIVMHSIMVGVAMGLGHMVYVLLRMNHATITSKPLGVGPIDVVVTALLASCGTVLFETSAAVFRKVLGILVTVFPSFAAAIMSCLTFAYWNILARRALGTSLYNYSMTLMALAGMACHMAVFLLLIFLLRRIGRKST